MNLKKPLKKCSKKGKIFGVCAGISKWCEIDVSIIRILFALSILFGGAGCIAYIILALILEDEEEDEEED